ncbi:WD repeat and coiled-coil-containing protein [Ctenodactylus gundi]
MELGQGKLLRSGLNTLYQATHPSHGLAWTDGSRVVLTDLQLDSGKTKFGDSEVIGQFEHVCGVSWGPVVTADAPALLAVQHKKHITVWQLCPSTLGSSKWLMSQISEIRESLPVLPQGCVWHPQNTVLAVLTAQDVSVFPNVHCDSSRVKVAVNTQGRIHCACWTQNGQRLLVAVGSGLHSYIWDSTQKTLHKCPSCPVLDLGSSICSLRATVDLEVAVTTELPLDKICSLNASEVIGVPTHKDVGPRTSPVGGEVSSADGEAVASETDSEIAVAPSSSDPLDLTHLRFNRPLSEASSLVCLRKKDYLTGSGQDSSHLVLVTFEKEVTVTRKVTVPGILVPDLIAVNLKAQVVAVASNTCNVILIYSVVPSSVPDVQQIELESNERPKGLCFVTDKLLLILVGKRKSTDTAFLSSAESDWYAIHLLVREVLSPAESSAASSKSQSAKSTFSVLNKTDGKKLIESLSPDFCHQNRGLLLTANTNNQGGRRGEMLIKEIESPSSSISGGSIALEIAHRPSWVWAPLPQPSSTPKPSDSPQRKNSEKETCYLPKELEILSDSMFDLNRCLSELMNTLRNGKKSSPAYPLCKEPPYVNVICQKACFEGATGKRSVLLCDGKLRLHTVQQAFGLSLVEMLHDSHWILLSADSEGFIPLTFTARQVVIVRDGALSMSDVSRDLLSQRQGPTPPPPDVEM